MGSTIAGLVRHARTHAEDDAYSEIGGASISYGRLLRTVCVLAKDYRSLPDTVGLLAPGGIEWVATILGLMAAGRTVVPLPDFFSQQQLAHIVEDAGISHILALSATAARARALAASVSDIALPNENDSPPAGLTVDDAATGPLVIYTSGSTGRPRGVRIGAAQLAHSALALSRATGASRGDTYLSVLPISLLLEQVCAIHVPLLTGVRVVFGGDDVTGDFAGLVDRVRPTLMVLVPQLLSAWTAALDRTGQTAPASLRLAATGGAPVSEALAGAAWRHGIPVHEGYGLSECCSVVALNRPGDRMAGTVGRPLEGVTVTLENGEIVVHGPTVMDGYLDHSGPAPAGIWHTGDLGAFDTDGRLIVHGRKDSMLVTAGGRNVVPEWIEAMVTADPRLALCILTDSGGGDLTAILVPHDAVADTYRAMSDTALARYVSALVAAAPAYARPSRCIVVPLAELQQRGLLTGNGRPRRAAIADAFAPPREVQVAVA